MRLISFVWKNLTRRRTRSVLTVVGLAVAVSAVVALVGVADSFSAHFRELYSRRGIDLVAKRGESGAELNNGMPESWGDDIKQVPGVSAALGGLMDLVSFPDEDNVIINGWPADSQLFSELKLLPGGRKPQAGERGKVLVGRLLAANLGVKVGDKIPLYGEKAEVIGIVDSDVVYEASAVSALQSDMQRWMNRPHQVTGFIIRSTVPKDKTPEHVAQLEALRKRIEALHPGLEVIPSEEFIDNVGAIKAAHGAAWATSAIALLIGAIGMLNTMAMSVFERIKEIGTLRAIGWRKLRVMRMILGESLLLSVAGGLLGTVCAVLFIHVLSHVPQVAGFIQGDIAFWVKCEGILLGVGVGVLGAIYPAYWAANLSPVEALRKK